MDHQQYAPIRKGLLEYVILQMVSAEKIYVADILSRLRDTEFATQEGTLYPLLSKMCREETLAYEWQESESGPPRKYYKLTAGGKKRLAEFRDYWEHLTHLIETLGKRT